MQGQQAEVDQLLPDLLLFPAGSDLHDHPLVANGSLVLQVRLLAMQQWNASTPMALGVCNPKSLHSQDHTLG